MQAAEMAESLASTMDSLHIQSRAKEAGESTATFFDLPLEIRQEIYRLCLLRKKVYSLSHYYMPEVGDVSPLGLSPLLVCRQMSLEAAAIFYQENVFTFILSPRSRLVVGPAYARLRKVEFRFGSPAPPDQEELGSGIWERFLANLTHVSIRVGQPVVFQDDFHEASVSRNCPELYEGQADKIKVYLQLFAKYLSKDCNILVKVWREESRIVIDACLGNRYERLAPSDYCT